MNDPRTPTHECRLLIVLDQVLVREGLLALFRTAAGITARATGAAGALRTARQFAPDVVLIHVSLPHAAAFSIARDLRTGRRPPRLLFLDDTLRAMQVRAVLEAGGLGYWTKHDSFRQLAEAVRRVAAGIPAFCAEVKPHLVETPDGLQFEPSPDIAAVAWLTRRESEVLAMLAKGLSVRQCAEQIGLSPSTVDNHKWRLMKKLSVHKMVDLARLAVREGLVED